MVLRQAKICLGLIGAGELQKHCGQLRYLMKSPATDLAPWFPEEITDTETILNDNYAIVVLNREIKIPARVVKKLWQNAKIRVTVDAGADRWFSFLQNNSKEKFWKLPDLFTGDFDSISPEALKTLSNNPKCRKVHTPDQDETDFTKALRVLKPYTVENQINKVIVFQETSGRLDQIMANINTLYKAAEIFENVQIYLLSSNALTWLLHPGKHSINIPIQLVEKKRWCALIPLSGKTIVSTSGLKWDLDNKDLEFGGLVSTSNTYSSHDVRICTNKLLLWSMGVFDHDD